MYEQLGEKDKYLKLHSNYSNRPVSSVLTGRLSKIDLKLRTRNRRFYFILTAKYVLCKDFDKKDFVAKVK